MSSAGARIDAIAVIGMAFRFPGDVHDEASMWNLLKNGKQGIPMIAGRLTRCNTVTVPNRAAASLFPPESFPI